MAEVETETRTFHAGTFTLGEGAQVISMHVSAPPGSPSYPARFRMRNTETGEVRIVHGVVPGGPYNSYAHIPISPKLPLGEYELEMLEAQVDNWGVVVGPLADDDPTTRQFSSDSFYGESEPLARQMSDWFKHEVEKWVDEEDSEVGFDVESSANLEDFYIQGHVNLRDLAAHLLSKGWSVPPAYAEGDWDDE